MPRSTYRPLTKSVSIAEACASGVHFTDLNGTTVNATYVQVVPLEGSIAAGAEEWFAVEPSSLVTHANYDGLIHASGATLPGTTDASAMVIGGPNNPVVELSLSYKDAVNSVKVSNNLGQVQTFIVTYGNIKPSNDLGDIKNLVDGAY